MTSGGIKHLQTSVKYLGTRQVHLSLKPDKTVLYKTEPLKVTLVPSTFTPNIRDRHDKLN